MHSLLYFNKGTCPTVHVKIGKLCRRRSDVREASENVSNVSRQFFFLFNLVYWIAATRSSRRRPWPALSTFSLAPVFPVSVSGRKSLWKCWKTNKPLRKYSIIRKIRESRIGKREKRNRRPFLFNDRPLTIVRPPSKVNSIYFSNCAISFPELQPSWKHSRLPKKG